MALSFTERFRTSLGRKKMRVVDVTHDGSTTAITPANLDLNYVDVALVTASTIAVSAGTTTLPDLTTNNGAALAVTALSSGSITTIMAIGS